MPEIDFSIVGGSNIHIKEDSAWSNLVHSNSHPGLIPSVSNGTAQSSKQEETKITLSEYVIFQMKSRDIGP